jgi:hypothetical protein
MGFGGWPRTRCFSQVQLDLEVGPEQDVSARYSQTWRLDQNRMFQPGIGKQQESMKTSKTLKRKDCGKKEESEYSLFQ